MVRRRRRAVRVRDVIFEKRGIPRIRLLYNDYFTGKSDIILSDGDLYPTTLSAFYPIYIYNPITTEFQRSLSERFSTNAYFQTRRFERDKFTLSRFARV